jgi:hypothetical protein
MSTDALQLSTTTEKYEVPFSIGGDLGAAVNQAKPIVIVTDVEPDDARAIALILKALSHLSSTTTQPINVAVAVGDGDASIRLNIIKTLVDCLRKDGVLKSNIKISYILGESDEYTSGRVFESVMNRHIKVTEENGSVSLNQFIKEHAGNGALIYGLKKPNELIQSFQEDPEIFAKSNLYTYVGVHNYITRDALKKTGVIELLKSFQSVKAFSNYFVLQQEQASNPKSITQENTPKISALLMEPDSYTVKFLKTMNIAWNTEIIFRLCNGKLDKVASEIIDYDDKRIAEAKGNTEGLAKRYAERGSHFEVIKSLQDKIKGIKRENGEIDFNKLDLNFMKSLAEDLQKLPQDLFIISIWTNIALAPELQSVIADELAALASFLPGLAEYRKGAAEFNERHILGINEEKPGNLEFGKKVADDGANTPIGIIDSLQAFFLSYKSLPSQEPGTIGDGSSVGGED